MNLLRNCLLSLNNLSHFLGKMAESSAKKPKKRSELTGFKFSGNEKNKFYDVTGDMFNGS